MKVSWHFCIARSVFLNSCFDAGLDAGKFTTGLKTFSIATFSYRYQLFQRICGNRGLSSKFYVSVYYKYVEAASIWGELLWDLAK